MTTNAPLHPPQQPRGLFGSLLLLDRLTRAAKFALVLVLIWVSVEAALTARAARFAVVKTASLVDYVQETLPGTVAETDAVLQRVGTASDAVAGMATEQKTLTAETTKKTNELLSVTIGAARKFDANLNDGLLPQAIALMKQMNEKTLPELTRVAEEGSTAIRENSAETKETLRAMRQVVLDLHALTGDPKWLQIAEDLDVSAKHIAGATGNVDEATKLALERLRQALKPGNFVLSVIKSLLGIGSQARIVIGK
jgi:hypothetical protein